MPNCRWEVVASKIPLELIQQHGGLEGLKGMGVAMQFYQRRLIAIRVGAFIQMTTVIVLSWSHKIHFTKYFLNYLYKLFINLLNFSLLLIYKGGANVSLGGALQPKDGWVLSWVSAG